MKIISRKWPVEGVDLKCWFALVGW